MSSEISGSASHTISGARDYSHCHDSINTKMKRKVTESVSMFVQKHFCGHFLSFFSSIIFSDSALDIEESLFQEENKRRQEIK